MRVVNLASLRRSLRVLKIEIRVLDVGSNMMALQMIFILKDEKIFISV
jgi:hypothetical protein